MDLLWVGVSAVWLVAVSPSCPWSDAADYVHLFECVKMIMIRVFKFANDTPIPGSKEQAHHEPSPCSWLVITQFGESKLSISHLLDGLSILQTFDCSQFWSLLVLNLRICCARILIWSSRLAESSSTTPSEPSLTSSWTHFLNPNSDNFFRKSQFHSSCNQILDADFNMVEKSCGITINFGQRGRTGQLVSHGRLSPTTRTCSDHSRAK
jgi:hypothetical protein